MLLQFRVDNQIITRSDDNKVVANSKNYLFCEFTFTEEWTGVITAVFKNEGKAYLAVLDENNRCAVPWEVIKPGRFSVSCFCSDRITSNKFYVSVLSSGYEEGETVSEPSPDVYAQITSKAEAAFSKSSEVYEAYKNGELNIPVNTTLFEWLDLQTISASDFEEGGAVETLENNFYVAENDIEVTLKNEAIVINDYEDFEAFAELYDVYDKTEAEALRRTLLYTKNTPGVIPRGASISIYKKNGFVALRTSQLLIEETATPYNDAFYLYSPSNYPIVITGDYLLNSVNGIVNAFIGMEDAGKHRFSIDERIIGTWIDGKPLYEKTVVFDFLDSTTGNVGASTQIPINVLNPEVVLIAEQYFYDNTSNVGATSQRIVPMYMNQATPVAAYYNMQTKSIGLAITGSSSYSVPAERGIRQLWFVIRYTKTTDGAAV